MPILTICYIFATDIVKITVWVSVGCFFSKLGKWMLGKILAIELHLLICLFLCKNYLVEPVFVPLHFKMCVHITFLANLMIKLFSYLPSYRFVALFISSHSDAIFLRGYVSLSVPSVYHNSFYCLYDQTNRYKDNKQ